jgi:hypothetical protein
VLLYAAVGDCGWRAAETAVQHATVTILIAALAVIGDLSVVLYYDHATTVTVNIVGLVLALAVLLLLLLLPTSRRYFQRPT